MSEPAESARLLDILLPSGGDLVTVSEAYFDESYDDEGPRILSVAGYYFTKSAALEFGRLWSRFLRANGLPYFHANEAAHREGVFEGWTDAEIDVVSRKLIALTLEYSSFGVAVALDQDVYEEVCGGHIMHPTPYTYALTNCLYGIAVWRDRAKRTSPTAFFFEQGHAHSGDAISFVNFLLRSDHLPDRLGYRSLSLVPKETPQVQPGDLLSWLWRLHTRRVSMGDTRRPMRGDLKALMARPQDHFQYFDRQRIEGFRDSIQRHTLEAENYVRQFAKMRGLPDDVAEFAATWMPDYRETRPVRARLRQPRRVR